MRNVIVGATLVILCGAFVYLASWSSGIPGKYPNLPYRRTVAQLAKRLATQRPEDVYSFIKTSYRRHDPVAVHDILHWFGSALYKSRGAEGLAVCDSSFNWGCFHGFFGVAFTAEGKELLPAAERICLSVPHAPSEPNGCLHGIGHGLLSLAGGYENVHLRRALSDCDRLVSLQSQKACYNGVFMEYNMRTMVGLEDSTQSLRKFDPEYPLEPCDGLEVRYQADCYYEQTDWWRLTLGRDWATMGEYCSHIGDDAVSESCFRGIGRGVWGESKFTPDKALSHCLGMPTDAGAEACTSIIAEELITLKHDPEAAQTFCLSLPEHLVQLCRQRLDNLGRNL